MNDFPGDTNTNLKKSLHILWSIQLQLSVAYTPIPMAALSKAKVCGSNPPGAWFLFPFEYFLLWW